MTLNFLEQNFRSSPNQPDCAKYKNITEEFPLLEAYMAALTGGPVGPSDMIGTANTTIIMATWLVWPLNEGPH